MTNMLPELSSRALAKDLNDKFLHQILRDAQNDRLRLKN